MSHPAPEPTAVAAPPPPPPGAASRLGDLDPVTRTAVRRTMRLSVFEGSLTQVFLNWTSGSVLIGFMLHLGASPAEIALVGSVPLLSQIASPAAAYLAAAFGQRKLLTVLMALVSRLTWLLAAALPLVPMPDAWRPSVLILVVLVSSFFLAANGTLWAAWMGDVVPERERGRFFGLRAGIVGVIAMVANLGAGAFLDRVAAPLSFQVVLVASVVIALLGVAIYLLQVDPPTSFERVRWQQLLTLPWREPGFNRFLRFALYWQFVVLLAAPFVFPYFLDELKLTFTQVAIWTSIAALTALATTYLWGRLADRTGNRGVLAIGTFLAGLLLPATWILAGLTGDVRWVWVSAVFDAIAWGAIGPAIFNLALVSAPRANRVVFIAMYSLGTGIAGFAGGVLSGPLLVFLRRFETPLFGSTWTAYHWLFVISGVLRMLAWLWLRSVPEADSWRTRDLLRSMRTGWKGMGFHWR
jgi:MFS family permease